MGSSDGDRDNFWVDGPMHLTRTRIDWNNDEHRRCITASLVKAVYVLESDRTKKREGKKNALARAWWEKFQFRKLHEYKIENACECVICKGRRRMGSESDRWFIYGAVFKYTQPDPWAPSHVVAFRGTMMRGPTVMSDMRHDLGILFNRQHECSRFVDAREIVQRLLSDHNVRGSRGEVWLAGHSLGASIALDVGRDMMVHHGLNLPTFLFNPPHVSLAPVIGEKARSNVYAVGYFLKYGLSRVIPSCHQSHMQEVFERLTPWVPNLYVNPLDPVCMGYIAYFEERQRMMNRYPYVAMVASRLSVRDMLRRLVRGRQSEQPHLLPFAILWKNTGSHQESAHELRQWWRPGLELQCCIEAPIEYTP